ncbi:alpha/beta fold hydrolase [Desulforamulus ruminis]|uniref:Alpha/beta hydrolase fold protein n=1 Tax=Desulforamulus ruminis (strain ATCC 23193 / DSM 2154 / NCIMB 8452 / DL) TaxID=696281 RepID=F6DK88_DESRL|nr:alpha/beta hydrolase [Desulforamulus ruminis]AEG61505.1 alpha/beta hydrolase fold protein [Desulforamulus ruminis DSM 2154]
MVKRFKSLEGRQLIYESYNRLLNLWEVSIDEIDLDTMYGKTHIILSGNKEKPPLLLFHGSGDNSAIMWFLNAKELAKHFYIVAVDSFGGAGKSEPNESYLKTFDPTLWLDNLLDSMNIHVTNIAGISYGGYMTLAYTAKRPDRVNKAVCMAGYPPVKGIKSFLIMIRSLKVFFPEILNPTDENAMKLLKKLCSPNFNESLLDNEMLKHWSYILKYSRVEKNKTSAAFDEQDMSLFRDKALFLIGEFDRAVYQPAVIKILKDYNLNYKIVKDTGHTINHERPELINREIIDFLAT